MKIAICFAGEPRFYQFGYKKMKSFYKDLDIDYYIHSWSTEQSINETLINLNNTFNPKKIVVECYKDFSNHFGGKPINLMSPNLSNAVSWLRSVYEVGKLIQSSNTEYDYVVFSRTDVAAIGKSMIDILNSKSKERLYTSYVNGNEWILDVNDDKKDQGIDTKFLCSSKENMIYFSKVYENLHTYILERNVPLCHHRLFYHHLKPLIIKHGHELVRCDDNHIHSGWYWIRNNMLQNN
jgi:hypothetical protein